MRTIRLRTKFLLSLVAISAGLSGAALWIVRNSVELQVRQTTRDDLQYSINTYQSFERQRELALTRSAELLADLPIVRALMTTRDAATIQDASAGIWRMSGSDLLVLGDRAGRVAALQSRDGVMARGAAQESLQHSLGRAEARNWWYSGGHLFEVWIQPIYLGAASENSAIGYLAVGHEIDGRAARDLGNLAASEVAFRYGGTLVASTLQPAQQAEWTRQMGGGAGALQLEAQEVALGSERYLVTSMRLFSDDGEPVSLSVLRSLDKATGFLRELNRLMLGLGIVTVLAGSLLAFWISDTFTRPLANLVVGVRALQHGDFNYPLESGGGDEVAEVTGAFDRMRSNLKKTLGEQRQLEERIRQGEKMEAVGRLAGGVAHDFNNLLTIIVGNGDILAGRMGEDARSRRSVEQMRKAAGRAVTLTRQLLSFSRKQMLQPRILDLNAVVADMGKMLPRLIGEHIEFVFQPGPEAATVFADPGQIEVVVLNLAVNARDAMPGGGKIVVDTRTVTLDEAEAGKRPPLAPGRYVLLSVADQGHGMDEETKAHIFEPFFTTKDVGKGTGLGLATVYGVVQQSGGLIRVESAPGEGATFEIYLPVSEGKSATAGEESKAAEVPRGNETVLVVEDEAGVRELAAEFLRENGYCVLEAKDGVEAMEVAARHEGTIHLLVSDMVMPRMSGLELAGQLKAVRPATKVVFMSGYSEYLAGQPEGESAQAAPLQKPFSRKTLVEKVSAVLAEG